MVKTLQDFNREYLSFHVKKEDLYWRTYMGHHEDSSALEEAQNLFKTYISNPIRIHEVKESLERKNLNEDEKTGLLGWKAFFESNSVEGDSAQKLQADVVTAESELHQRRSKVRLTFRNEAGEEVEATTNVLSTHLSTSTSEGVRKSSHQGLLQLEKEVLAAGFLDLVGKRNEFARSLGFKDFFEFRVWKNEAMSVDQLFRILDEFELMTRETHLKSIKKLKDEKGPSAVEPHNLRYSIAGDAEKALSPYFPFQKAIEIWMRSFARMKIQFRDADLTLDLLDRNGKYENGFMHGPQPSYFDQGRWVPARINFTSNASPGLPGSGRTGLMTLFHEGGHAAHFSNITGNAPCFSQEFPPTSMAYAETQSMFCDSILGDADWIALYARDLKGNPPPTELIKTRLTLGQPFRAFAERSILVVPVFERRLYAMKDSERTAENVLKLARDCEREIQGVECSPRPLLAIPHLLGSEGACSYQGYLLAHMAVYQLRAHFLNRDGFITDNPRVGPDLTRHAWEPGNKITHSDSVRAVTGEGLSGRALAEECNLSPEELWNQQKTRMEAALKRTPPQDLSDLKATIRVVHGDEIIADNTQSMQKLCNRFEEWITAHHAIS